MSQTSLSETNRDRLHLWRTRLEIPLEAAINIVREEAITSTSHRPIKEVVANLRHEELIGTLRSFVIYFLAKNGIDNKIVAVDIFHDCFDNKNDVESIERIQKYGLKRSFLDYN